MAIYNSSMAVYLIVEMFCRTAINLDYHDLTDRVNQVIDRQDDFLDHLKNGDSGNGDVNGDSLANGNENGYSDEPIGISSPPPADPTTYSHQGCDAPLEKMQRYCGGCGQKID